MAEERKLSVSEVRKTVSTSMGAAFGFVIGLLWSNVVMGAMTTAGIDLTSTGSGWGDWAIFVAVAIVMTVVMIVLIIVISRWGSKA